MADVQKTIEIIFGVVDNTGSGLTGVADGIDTFIDKVSSVTGPLADLGDKVIQTEATIVALGAALVSFSVREAAQFQTAALEIGTLFGANADQAQAYGDEIKDFATTSTQSLDAITQATYAAISAGIQQADALKLVATAEKLAVAGNADLEATTTTLVSTLNAYGVSADQAAAFSDIFFKTVQIGQTTVPDLSASLAQVTGIAAAAGVPFATLGAAIAALTAAGLPTSQAITGIKAALANIIQPSKEASDAAKELGVKFDASALQSRGFEGVLADLMTATGGNIGTMSQFFGSVEALNIVMALGQQGGTAFRTALDAMATSAGSTDAAFQLMSQGASLSLQTLQNNLKITLIDAGLPLLDDFGKAVSGLSSILQAVDFSIRADAFQPIYDALQQAAEGLSAYLQGIANALPDALAQVDFSGLADAFSDLSDSFGDLFGELDLTKPEDLADAIQFVVDSVESLTRVTEGMVDAWGPAIQTVVDAIDEFNDLDTAQQNAAGATLSIAQQFEYFKVILETFSGGVEAVGTGLEAIAAIMGVRLVGDVLPKLAYGLGSVIGVLGQAGLVAAAGSAGFAIGTLVNDGLTDLITSVTGTHNSLGTLIYELTHTEEAIDAIDDVSADAAASIEQIADAATAAEAEIDAMAQAIEDAGAGADDFATQTFKVVDAQGKVKEVTIETQDELDAYLKKLDDTSAELQKNEQYTADLADTTSDMIPIIDTATGKITGYEQNLAKGAVSAGGMATATDDAAKAAKEAAKQQEEWNQKIAEMAHEEKMEAIKSATEVAVASITADADTMVASFDSVADSLTSINDLVGDLFGMDAPDWDPFGFNIQEAAEQALEIQREMADAQLALIEEQITALQLKNDRMRDGLPEIVISADGLEPSIEAFMFQILNKIQVRASQLGAEWLVGGGTVTP